VGVEVRGGAPDGAQAAPLLVATAFASQSYSPEYRPGAPDPGALVRLSRLGGGRGAIAAAASFDPSGLPAGHRRVLLTGWLLVLAALLWPADVALRRLALHGAAWRAIERARERVRPKARVRPAGAAGAGASAAAAPAVEPAPARRERRRRAEAPQAPATVQRLLLRKQGAKPPDDADPAP
jgi:hypothetical protein